ncbi:VOC family protein [Telluribacter sp. SYSU D00476]|uniref:VOC family protein n=1 Tax=Telluribacter sp. SYSU D00476 TaxID=2811430 RepID=UPI001FF6F39C|nr:VOC family protein [Telluribacter sp. SYSU D00476]
MQKITTFLTFNDQAEEAVNLYTSLFKNSGITKTIRYGDGGHLPKGTVMSIMFQLEGQEFMALNGGPYFTFSNGTSLFVHCDTQQEVDELWDKLSYGGEKGRCGWLKDKFGLSWQIIPATLGKYLHSEEAEKAGRAVHAMMQMGKINIEAISLAYHGQETAQP